MMLPLLEPNHRGVVAWGGVDNGIRVEQLRRRTRGERRNWTDFAKAGTDLP
jgi:hypothetical protein